MKLDKCAITCSTNWWMHGSTRHVQLVVTACMWPSVRWPVGSVVRHFTGFGGCIILSEAVYIILFGSAAEQGDDSSFKEDINSPKDKLNDLYLCSAFLRARLHRYASPSPRRLTAASLHFTRFEAFITISDKGAGNVARVVKIRLWQHAFGGHFSVSSAPSSVRAQRCRKDHRCCASLAYRALRTSPRRLPTFIGFVSPNASSLN